MKNKKYRIEIPVQAEAVKIQYEIETGNGVDDIRIHMESEKNIIFPPVTCKVIVPASGIHYLWNPKIHLIKALNSDWFQNLKKVNGYTGAPVQCLMDSDHTNCVTAALSDTMNTISFWTLPVEETAEYAFEIGLFADDVVYRRNYDLTIRLDQRRIPYYESLSRTVLWWEEDERNRPAYVPPLAKEPMYSTWYSFHQMLTEEELLKQCRLAKKAGCCSILLDDGWQTEDSSRGYAYCGDWQPAPSKIPDMKAFVEKCHALDMKVMPWYSVPFIGEKSKNFERYQDMLIDPVNDREWYVLDPRYKEVREFLIGTYEKALKEWNLDGFKLDFIDEFVVTPFSGKAEDRRRDFESFTEATDCLMKECIRRLKKQKPDILLEFRQTYNGPLMRSYGNIFRAVDCPLDALENHVRVTDIRLLCGNSAVHSDMLMWNQEEPVESAALQMIQILFSVPQISMRLDELDPEHEKMLLFYCSLWKTYQDAFINGSFEPLNPIGRYDIVKGRFQDQFVCTYHSARVIELEKLCKEMVFVNGTSQEKLYISNKDKECRYEVAVYDCMGNCAASIPILLTEGLSEFMIPRSGTAVWKQR